jgi:hypothetical protein
MNSMMEMDKFDIANPEENGGISLKKAGKHEFWFVPSFQSSLDIGLHKSNPVTPVD